VSELEKNRRTARYINQQMLPSDEYEIATATVHMSDMTLYTAQ